MRDKILSMLIENRDRYISGEKISNDLHVSRAAVWKYIRSFREEGYDIEASSRKGYRLQKVPDSLEPGHWTPSLYTCWMGRTARYFGSISSTNDKAKELAFEGAPHGTLVLAEQQTAGRGRLGRAWVSPSGTGIWMSVILRPTLEPADGPKTTLLCAVAVARAIRQVTGLEARIKWPNDIILEGRKVCGILTEMNADMDRIHWVVLGIGINVNQKADNFPEELGNLATSLRVQAGHIFKRTELLTVLCRELEEWLDRYMENKDFSPVVRECTRLSVTLGRKVRVTGSCITMEGTAESIDGDGSLMIRREDGSLYKVISGDLSVRGILGYV